MTLPSAPSLRSLPVLLTGATGYVGGRLLRLLAERGARVRALARRPEALRASGGVEVVAGDLLEPATLAPALRGIEVAYYLVHSMGAPGDFEELDRRAARDFGAAARAAGVRRIVYLGALASEGAPLSPHLRSRHEVGEILRACGLQVVELRASIVIGSGSLSFELVRALVERLPVMVTPRWVSVVAQPIAVDDLLEYLVASSTLPFEGDPIFEIGGADQVSYGGLMREYARQRGLRRWMVPVPVLTPRLSSLWLGLVTPLYARVGRALIDSIRHPSVVTSSAALRCFDIRPRGVREAIAAALRNEDREFAETRWSDAQWRSAPARDFGGRRFGNRLVDSRSVSVAVDAERAFAPIRRIGGRRGWYYADRLWTLRGLIDLALGGAGMRRGRRDPESLRPGDALDCWRVERCDPPRLLRLRAEMRLPGRAWLEFEVVPGAQGSIVRQTAIFDPVGLAGLAYWYAIWPLHQIVFAGMLRALAREARSSA